MSADVTGFANRFSVHTSPPGMDVCACVMLVRLFQKNTNGLVSLASTVKSRTRVVKLTFVVDIK